MNHSDVHRGIIALPPVTGEQQRQLKSEWERVLATPAKESEVRILEEQQ